MGIRWPLNSFLKNYTENHQKWRNSNIYLLTSAIFRGLRSVFFNFFFYCIKNISESLHLKNYCVISFFSKIIQYFVGVDCGVYPPPSPGYDNFLLPPPPPRRIGLKKTTCVRLPKENAFSPNHASETCIFNSWRHQKLLLVANQYHDSTFLFEINSGDIGTSKLISQLK